MRDFTLKIYKKLLTELLKTGYGFVTFAEYIQDPDKKERIIILRHDVERLPCQALKMAQIEHESGVKASYYFCCHRNGFDESVIRTIAALGHEIGYHYEDLSRSQGNFEMAITAFEKNLALLRKLAVVSTICMHGSPFSRFDNRDLWKNFEYRSLGIIGEPYFDIDFNEVMYLTDTGRRWDGSKVSIRDKVIGDGQHKLSTDFGGSNLSVSSGTREVMGKREKKIGDRLEVMGYREDSGQKTEDRWQKEKDSRGVVCDPPALHHEIVDRSQEPVVSSRKKEPANKLKLHSTMDIIKALENDLLPSKIMLTIHPQRWTDNYFLWTKELIWQKIKNPIKYLKLKRMEKNLQKINGK